MRSFRNARGVTPSDSEGLGFTTQAITVGVAGGVTVDMAGGENNVSLSLSTGWSYIQVTKIYDTGTTATGIAAYW